MQPQNSKPGQQSAKTVSQNNSTGIAAVDMNEDQSEANANKPSNSNILGAIHALREDFFKYSVKMLEAINSFSGNEGLM